MENYKGINSMMKLKRKEIDHGVDHDFPLSSPAHKIRRLDAELSPIVEEVNEDLSMRYEEAIPENVILNGVGNQVKMRDLEELPDSIPENQERAIVLFKPINNPVPCTLTHFSVDPNFIATFKGKALWGVNRNADERIEKQEDSTNGDNGESCRAVVPWAPSYKPNLKHQLLGSQMKVSELDSMNEEEPEATSMEIEDTSGPEVNDYNRVLRPTEGISSQWWQPHCMFPQPLQNTTTPLVWYR
ncbi:uncharacterized protein LOC141605866 [Silene latifolia]|uniref:uncharacterized protein LOC141605866 n=1 Tax=Silene latifolia TaxID=37657 RepID=UPI003D773A6D